MSAVRALVTAVTDRGIARPDNEDALGLSGGPVPDGAVLAVERVAPIDVVVADGMGGHAAGAEASALAVRTWLAAAGTTAERIRAADDAVRAAGARSAALRGMGTTIAGARIDEHGGVDVASVGDSRVYRVLDGYPGLLTRDDRIDGTTMLTRHLGGGERAVPQSFSCRLQPGDGLVLITDGVHDVLDDGTMAELLRAGGASALRDAVLAAGAPDNLTVVVVELLPPQTAPTRAES